jgi:hypothetical protein
MKKTHIIICILLLGCFESIYCQIENLDKLNGYKVFKLGDSPSKHSTYIQKNEVFTPPSKNVSIYNCHAAEYLSFGITFKGMELRFFDNKLYEILMWSSWEGDEYEAAKAMLKKSYFDLIADEAERIFGKMMRFTKDEGALLKIGATGIWETEKNRFDIVFMQYYSGKVAIQVKFTDKNLESQVSLSKYQ